MSSSCRKHRQSCKIFSESRAFWKHFVTSQSQAAAPHLQFEKMVMPKATWPRNGAVRPGNPSDLGGRRDLEASVRLSCPLSAMGDALVAGRPPDPRRSPRAPTCPTTRANPGPRPHPRLVSCGPILSPRTRPQAAMPRRSPRAGTCLRLPARTRARSPAPLAPSPFTGPPNHHSGRRAITIGWGGGARPAVGGARAGYKRAGGGARAALQTPPL